MHLSGSSLLIAGILVLTCAVSLAAYPLMPDRIASHWGLSGEANGYLPKAWGLSAVPLIAATLALLFIAIPRIDPLKENIRQFRKDYDHFVAVILLFLLYLQLLVILWNLGGRFNFSQLLCPAFAILFYATGILVGRARRNWFVGIRTPWTLSSEKVWQKTHALGGKLFRIAALVTLIGVLLPSLAPFFILGPVLAVSAYLVVYSYVEYQGEAAPRGGG